MKLAVSYDQSGNITTLFDPDSVQVDQGFFTYVPAPSEHHTVLDLPRDLEAAPFVDLPFLLRVNMDNEAPVFEHREITGNADQPHAGPTSSPDHSAEKLD